MADPFLAPDDFATQYGQTLSDGDSAVAERLLQITSDWIRANAPDADDDAAAQVVFEVTRDQLNLGEYSPLAQFTNITAHRTEAGRFDDSSDLLENILTNRQRRWLGLPVVPDPVAACPVNDIGIAGIDYPDFSPYGFPYPFTGFPGYPIPPGYPQGGQVVPVNPYGGPDLYC